MSGDTVSPFDASLGKLTDATPTGATPLGLPTQHSAQMSPWLSGSLDALRVSDVVIFAS